MLLLLLLLLLIYHKLPHRKKCVVMLLLLLVIVGGCIKTRFAPPPLLSPTNRYECACNTHIKFFGFECAEWIKCELTGQLDGDINAKMLLTPKLGNQTLGKYHIFVHCL
jgi:hypothetical protein